LAPIFKKETQMETPRMYFSIHYENGTSSFQYEINTPVTDARTVLEAIDNFVATTMEEVIEEEFDDE
jgi:hypothetical protein